MEDKDRGPLIRYYRVDANGVRTEVSAPSAGYTIRNGAVWDVALTQNEIDALASGVDPRLIRPKRLLVYFPLYAGVSSSSSSSSSGDTVAGMVLGTPQSDIDLKEWHAGTWTRAAPPKCECGSETAKVPHALWCPVKKYLDSNGKI